MALNSGFANLDPVADTFSDWLNKTNEMITLMREDVITANTAGAETSGDATLVGSFYANNLIAHDSLRGGDYAASDVLYISSNVHIQNTAADTIVWKDFEVNGNAHFGATSNGTHTVQVTGDFLVSAEATFQNDMYIDGTSANAVQWLSATNIMNFNDSVALTFGSDSDLTIQHDSTDTTIVQSGVGNLVIKSANLNLTGADGTNYILAQDGTSVIIYSPQANTVELTANDAGIHIETEANTGILRARGITNLESDVNIQGSDNTDTVTWDKSANTLNFDDSNFVTFGTAGDLSIFHDATNSYIRNVTGELIAQGDGITLRSHTGTESYLTADLNGAVTLFHDNNSKLATQAGGVTVTGNVVSDGFVAGDGEKVQLGASQDLQLYHETTGNSIIAETGGGSLVLKGNNVIIQSTGGENYLQGVADGSTTVYYNGVAKIATTTNGVEVTGLTDTDTLLVSSTSTFQDDIGIEGSTDANTVTWDKSANTLNFADDNKVTFGGASDLQIYHDGTASFVDEQGTGSLNIRATNLVLRDSSDTEAAAFISGGEGRINHAGSTKIQTTSTGATITGTLVADGVTVGDSEIIQLGTTLQLYNDGANSYIVETGTADLNIQANSMVLEDTDGTNYINMVAGGAVTLTHAGNDKLVTSTDGVTVTGTVVADGLTVGDNETIVLGTDSDLTVKHSGTNATIENATGELILQSNGITLQSNHATPETYMTADADGSVVLYYDNTTTLTTRSGGVNIVGEANTDTLLVNGISNTTGIAYFGSSVRPSTTGNDLGTASFRWDAFLTNVDSDGYIQPTSNTQNLGQTNARWKLFANTIDTSSNVTIGGFANVVSTFEVQSTSTFKDDVLVDTADLTCTANVVTENLQVNGTANVNILQMVDVVANNFAIVGGEGETTVSSTATDIVVDTVAATDSNGFKYFIEGRNTNADSCYVVEISVAHNGTDVFFTRYGEIGNNFDAVWNVGMNGANVELMVTCSGAAPVTNVHSFNIIKYQTR